MLEHTSRKRWLLACLSAGIALGFVGTTATAWADNDSYTKSAQVPVALNAYTCTFTRPAAAPPHTPFAFNTSSGFTFDISWVDQDRGEYLLAEGSHGRPSLNTQGGVLANATSGDLLVINTDNPGAGTSTILPPVDDPFAGHRCDANVDFGGVFSGPPVVSAAVHPTGDRNSISGPNGVFTMNGNQAWVGDGPSYFNPGQHDLASDYATDPCDSSVRVFDLNTKRQIAHINVHGCFRTDEGAGDPVDQVALFANPGEIKSVRLADPNARNVDSSPFVTLISTVARREGDDQDEQGDDDWGGGHFRILKQINFDGITPGTVDTTPGCAGNCGGIEQAVYSRQTGLFYIAIPDNGTGTGDGFVSTVDPRPGAGFGTVHTYALAAGTCPGGPAGASLGPNHSLLLGCGGASASGGEVVIKDITALTTSPVPAANETVLQDGSQSCDEVYYDAGSGHFGGACNFTGAANPGIFGVLINDAHTVPAQFDVNADPAGASGAHSIAADWINAQFWVPKVGGDCLPLAPACVAIYSGDDTDAQSP